jgi:hypothetical protein
MYAWEDEVSWSGNSFSLPFLSCSRRAEGKVES